LLYFHEELERKGKEASPFSPSREKEGKEASVIFQPDSSVWVTSQMQKTSVDLYPERTPASTWLSICASWWLLLKPEMKRRGSNGEAADGKQGTVFLSVPHYWSWETLACSLIP
jgi:hypothetical protein